MDHNLIRLDDDAIHALVEDIFNKHNIIVSSEKGFNASEHLSQQHYKEVIEKLYSAVISFSPPYSDTYENIFTQIATFAHHLAKDHIFYDANKRTTVAMLFSVLNTVNITLQIHDSIDPEENELYQWIQGLVTEQYSIGEFAYFLQSHVQK